MRCPDCNKFTSYDEPEVEATVDLVRVSAEGEVEAVEVAVEISLNCQECGLLLKQANDTTDCVVTFDDKLGVCSDEDGHEWECDEVDAEPTSRSDQAGRTKFKVYHGAALNGTVECLHCGAKGAVSGSVEVAQSDFEEQV